MGTVEEASRAARRGAPTDASVGAPVAARRVVPTEARGAVGPAAGRGAPAAAIARGAVAHQALARRERRARRRRIADQLAQRYGGVVRRQALIANGISPEEVRTELRVGFWRRAGRHTLSIDAREPHDRGRFWWAVWESGPRAVLDGVSALIWCGLTGWTEQHVWVSVPRNATLRDVPGIHRHYTRDLGPVNRLWIPHAEPAAAAVRAAQWAVTDAQGATVLAMAVQQRIARPEDVLAFWGTVLSSPRRDFLDVVIRDVCDGAHSLNELDVARLCRQRGFPEPTRQRVRRGRNGRVYLDVYWDDLGVHLEIQGAHHFHGLKGVEDALRSNEQAILHADDIQLQLPVLGLRTRPDAFMDQIGQALEVGRRRRAARSHP